MLKRVNTFVYCDHIMHHWQQYRSVLVDVSEKSITGHWFSLIKRLRQIYWWSAAAAHSHNSSSLT